MCLSERSLSGASLHKKPPRHGVTCQNTHDGKTVVVVLRADLKVYSTITHKNKNVAG